jgi:hypothetical protein
MEGRKALGATLILFIYTEEGAESAAFSSAFLLDVVERWASCYVSSCDSGRRRRRHHIAGFLDVCEGLS